MSIQEIISGDNAYEVRTKINENAEELYAYHDGNWLFAGGAFGGSGPTFQLIQPDTWTDVIWQEIPGNLSAMVREADKINWSRDSADPRAMGLWSSLCFVAWENTDAALVGPHRRWLKMQIAPQSTGVYVDVAETETVFHPDMDDLSTPSSHGLPAMDAHNVSTYTKFQVKHNAETAINIVAVGFVDPLLMCAKVSEY